MKQLTQVILILFFFFPFISQASNYKIGQTLHVVANDGLVLRSKPSTYGDKLITLQHGEKVVIKELTDQKANIFGFDGNWVKIQTENQKTGYVFDAFLSTLPIAKSVSDMVENMPQNSFELGNILPGLLQLYISENFPETGCTYEYGNHSDGESAHRMEMKKLEGGHTVIEHGYWEGNATELQLVDKRPSEIFYLMQQFFKGIDENLLKLDEENLRKPIAWRNEKNCVAELNGNGCGVELFKDQDGLFSIYFIFPCC